MLTLISVSDKRGIVELAKKLKGDIISTGGTAKILEENDIEVTTISEYTGVEETRELKTLHSTIFRNVFSGKIGMVVVNFYPFLEEPCIENIDIGGVCLLRAAAKNYHKTIPVCNPQRYDELLDKLDDMTEEFRLGMAREAFNYVAAYDRAIAQWFEGKLR